MNIERIKGLLLQEFYITYRSLEVIMDLLFFSLVNAITFGFFNVYFLKFGPAQTASYLYLGILLMEIVRITQYTTSLNALWNIWSRNLSNLFVTPITIQEYLFSQMASGSIKAGAIFILISVVAKLFFGFDIFSLGLINLFFFYLNLVIFSWSFGIAVLGVIFKLGSRFSAFAWSLIFALEPIMGTFFPVNILPSFLQTIAYALPPTYVFEGARVALVNPQTNWDYILKSLGLNILYFAIALIMFNYLFKKSKETGQFARNE